METHLWDSWLCWWHGQCQTMQLNVWLDLLMMRIHLTGIRWKTHWKSKGKNLKLALIPNHTLISGHLILNSSVNKRSANNQDVSLMCYCSLSSVFSLLLKDVGLVLFLEGFWVCLFVFLSYALICYIIHLCDNSLQSIIVVCYITLRYWSLIVSCFSLS